MPMTAVTTRRLSSSLLALTSLCVLGLAGCAAKYNNAAGITPQPVEILWNTTGPAQMGTTPVAPTASNPNPPVTLPAPASPIGTLFNSTPLGPNELNATANTLGTFVYTPAEGSFLSPGTQTLSVTFTPVDTTNYAVTTRTVQIQVYDIAAASSAPLLAPAAVQIIGGGYVDGVVFHPLQKNLRYVRTDVGGAYRWDQQTYQPMVTVNGVAETNPCQPKPPTGNDHELLQYGNWTPLLDFVGRTNAGDMGVESIGIDPTDPMRLYLATGLNYNNDATQQNHFYLSDDQGNTFTVVNAPFPINGAAAGRDAGERFGVDPNLGTTIYYGTRTAGLWKSVDRGVTWNQVTSFPVTGPTNGAGVVFVSFVAGSGAAGAATPVIYAGVSDYNYYNADGTNNGAPTYSPIYRSVDAGATWQAVPGQPTTVANPSGSTAPANYNLTPVHGVVGADGVTNSTGSFYVTYFSDAGPTSSLGNGAGAVYQYTPTPGTPAGAGTWTNITPYAVRATTDIGGYGGLALDPSKPGVIMVGTMDDYTAAGVDNDDIYRSLDYGQTWVSLARGPQPAANDPYDVPWIAFGGEGSATGTKVIGKWPSTIAIDPFSSNHVEYGNGQALWDSTDVENADLGQASQVIFQVGAYGAAQGGRATTTACSPVGPGVPGGASIEETVVNSLSSPPSGSLLLSAVNDLGTFISLNLGTSPTVGSDSAPQLGTGTSVDFAQNKALTVIRVGTVGSMTSNITYVPVTGSAAGTTCSAASATCIPVLLAYSTEGGESLDNNEWTGVSAPYDATHVSAGGGTVAISPDASSFVWATVDFPPVCSGNFGQTITAVTNGIIGAQVISDRVNPGVYYMYDSVSGKLQMGTASVSSGSAATPFQCTLSLATQQTLPAGSTGQLAASYGAAGEIWLAVNGSPTASANGLYHSTDFGKTLTQVSGFSEGYAIGIGAPATSAAFATYSKPAVYASATGASGYGFYRSIDDGATWVQVSSPLHLLGTVNVMTGDPRTFGRFYIGTAGRGIGYLDSQ